MEQVLDDTIALRMGLAAKALPEIGLPNLVDFLTSLLQRPITEKKLRSLSPGKFYKGLLEVEQRLERSHSNQAFAILTSANVDTMAAPNVPELPTLSGPKTRVAISSNNQQQIDGHFNSCLRFLIYEVNAEQFQLVAVRPVETTETGNSRPAAIVELIQDCHLLSTLSIGGPAAARVIRSDIHPMKVPSICTSEEFLTPLIKVIQDPPPWLKKRLFTE